MSMRCRIIARGMRARQIPFLGERGMVPSQ